MNRQIRYPSFMLILPLSVFALFFVIPSTIGYVYAFTDWNMYVPRVSFVGLENFYDVLSDDALSLAFSNTVIFALVKTLIVTVFGYLFALILNRNLKSRDALRTIYFTPAIFSPLVVGLIFAALFNSQRGTVNQLLDFLHLSSLKFEWLGRRWPAVFTINLAEIWRSLGYAIVITLAGLQSIPTHYLEAARIDGASAWQDFWNITLPLTLPVVNVNILFSLIYGLKMFDLVYILTTGGPGHDTETFGTLIINEMANGRFAHSTAINLIFTIFLVIVAVIYQRVTRRLEEEI